MSAQSLVASSVYPLIKTGLLTTVANQSTNVTFITPFPVGSLPLIFIQNTEGAVQPTIFFTVQNLTNTGFTIIQTFVSPIVGYQNVAVSYLAVWDPVTPPP